MGDSISIKVKTMSNLLIGGVPMPFEIGGIDQYTAMDQNGFPYIPGSSFKGALRAIVRADQSKMGEEITQLYVKYFEKVRKEDYWNIEEPKREKGDIKIIQEQFNLICKNVSPEYIFGIKGFNNTPKMLFSDLYLCKDSSKDCDKNSFFSIDMKNCIYDNGVELKSNPRSYKVAREGLNFEGEIGLYRIELLGEDAKELCKNYIIYNLEKFNEGIYRLGNSKSRGYGKVKTTVVNKKGG